MDSWARLLEVVTNEDVKKGKSVMSGQNDSKATIELEALFERADHVVATSVIGRPRHGSGYVPKVDAKIRLNVDVMNWLKAMGPRHYSRINGLLTALMEADRNTSKED